MNLGSCPWKVIYRLYYMHIFKGDLFDWHTNVTEGWVIPQWLSTCWKDRVHSLFIHEMKASEQGEPRKQFLPKLKSLWLPGEWLVWICVKGWRSWPLMFRVYSLGRDEADSMLTSSPSPVSVWIPSLLNVFPAFRDALFPLWKHLQCSCLCNTLVLCKDLSLVFK